MNIYKGYINDLLKVFNAIDTVQIENIYDLILDCINQNKTIFTCGNGGSGYNASHIITDWNKMSYLKNNLKVRAISLVDNIGLLTAWSNDVGYEEIFSGQLKSLAKNGDILIALSGSGNSKNTLNAVSYMNQIQCETISIVGYDGGSLKKISNHCIHIPSFDMQICEDIQMMIGHIFMKKLCE